MNSSRLFSFMAIATTTIALLSGSTNLFGLDGYEVINQGTTNEYVRLKAKGIHIAGPGCGNITFTLKNPDDAITLQGVDANGNLYDVPKFMLVAEHWNYPSGFDRNVLRKTEHMVNVIGRAGLGSGAKTFGFDNADYHISLYEITKTEQTGARADGGVAVVVGTGTKPTEWRVTRQPLTRYVDIQYKTDINCESAPAGSLNMREPNRNTKFPGNELGDFIKYPISM